LLQFVNPAGRVINASGAPLHVVARTLYCHSRKEPSGSSVLQSPTIPVVPVEAVASSFFRQFSLDSGSFYDLSKPGLYSVTFNGEALTFDTNDPSAKIDNCEQFPGTIVVNVGAVTGRNSYSIVSNTLQFVIGGPGAAGPVDHIVIGPSSSSIGTGGTEFYTAQGFDASNNSLGDVTSATTFTITPNGSCSGATCTAATSGSHTVTGTLATKTATATLTVAPVSNVVKVWVGLANSDDVGIRFDLKAVVTKNGSPVGSGQLGSVSGGSSNFNTAVLDTIPIVLAGGPVGVSGGDTLNVEVLVRNACSRSGKSTGTARLWIDGAPRDSGATRDAGSRLSPSPETPTSTLYFLRSLFKLGTTPGSSRTIIDRQAGPKCAPYQSFGTWTLP
jgi:hypothetical protein